MPRFRPRISLLTALLLMTILGMAIVVARLWREVGPLRAEVRQLRDETGRLSVDDRAEVHAMQVRTKEPFLWKWRVWVPEGSTVNVLAQWGSVPRTGVPAGVPPGRLEPGEQWITMRVMQHPKDGAWFAQFETEKWGFGLPIKQEDCWWNWPGSGMYAEGVQNQTGVQDDPDEPFILTRYRTDQSGDSSELQKNDAPTAGFIIWLERK